MGLPLYFFERALNSLIWVDLQRYIAEVWKSIFWYIVYCGGHNLWCVTPYNFFIRDFGCITMKLALWVCHPRLVVVSLRDGFVSPTCGSVMSLTYSHSERHVRPARESSLQPFLLTQWSSMIFAEPEYDYCVSITDSDSIAQCQTSQCTNIFCNQIIWNILVFSVKTIV